VSAPIRDAPGDQAGRSTIEHAPLSHISNVIGPVEVDTMPVARDLISRPDECADVVDEKPQSKGVMCRIEYVARSGRRGEDTRRPQDNNGYVMQILQDNPNLHSAVQQKVTVDAMQVMKDEQARRDEVQLKVISDLQAEVSAMSSRRDVSVMQDAATRSGVQTEDLLGDIEYSREDRGSTMCVVAPCFSTLSIATSANTSDNRKDIASIDVRVLPRALDSITLSGSMSCSESAKSPRDRITELEARISAQECRSDEDSARGGRVAPLPKHDRGPEADDEDDNDRDNQAREVQDRHQKIFIAKEELMECVTNARQRDERRQVTMVSNPDRGVEPSPLMKVVASSRGIEREDAPSNRTLSATQTITRTKVKEVRCSDSDKDNGDGRRPNGGGREKPRGGGGDDDDHGGGRNDRDE
jgi:hypothetical protein